jgi:hypothetical protein
VARVHSSLLRNEAGHGSGMKPGTASHFKPVTFGRLSEPVSGMKSESVTTFIGIRTSHSNSSTPQGGHDVPRQFDKKSGVDFGWKCFYLQTDKVMRRDIWR